MQALPQLLGLQNLDSIIDCLLPMIMLEKSLLGVMCTTGYAYALML
ncbi:MAG: hypothetical protein V7L02_10375 [Nostoc sp.]